MRCLHRCQLLAFAGFSAIAAAGCLPELPPPSTQFLPGMTSSPSASSPSPQVSPTTHPRIISAETQQRVLSLLRTNGACSMPCYWGITSGQTPWNEAQAIIHSLNTVNARSDQDAGLPMYIVSLDHFREEGAIIHSLEFTIGDGIVQRVNVSVENHEYPEFAAAWTRYSLAEFFRSLGQPSEAFVYLSDIDPSYATLFLFEERGAALMIVGKREDLDAICPQLGSRDVITNIDFSLANLDSGLSITPDTWIPPSEADHWRLLSEVLGLHDEGFYQAVISGTQDCWPIRSQ